MNLRQRVVRHQSRAPVYAGLQSNPLPENPELALCLRMVEDSLASLRAPATVSVETIDRMLLNFAANLGVRDVHRWSWVGWYEFRVRVDHLVPQAQSGWFMNCMPRRKRHVIYPGLEFEKLRADRKPLSLVLDSDRLVMQELDRRRLANQARVHRLCWLTAPTSFAEPNSIWFDATESPGDGAANPNQPGSEVLSDEAMSPTAGGDSLNDEYLLCRPKPKNWHEEPRFGLRKRPGSGPSDSGRAFTSQGDLG